MASDMTLPPLIPVEDLFRPPTRAAAKISPDGTRIAFLSPSEGRLNVWVEDLEPGSPGARRVTDDSNRSILHFEWTDDPRWLIYLQDTNGDENWHITASTSTIPTRLPSTSPRSRARWPSPCGRSSKAGPR